MTMSDGNKARQIVEAPLVQMGIALLTAVVISVIVAMRHDVRWILIFGLPCAIIVGWEVARIYSMTRRAMWSLVTGAALGSGLALCCLYVTLAPESSEHNAPTSIASLGVTPLSDLPQKPTEPVSTPTARAETPQGTQLRTNVLSEDKGPRIIYPIPTEVKQGGRVFAHFATLEQMLQPYMGQTSQENQNRSKIYIDKWVVIRGYLSDIFEYKPCNCTVIRLDISMRNEIGVILLFNTKKWKSQTITMHKDEKIEASCSIDVLDEKFVRLTDCNLIS